jgi:Arc/MetJ-type ribon-helix-helix transcriptional regulator
MKVAGKSPCGIEATMALTITLPEHIQAYIDQQIAEGRFDSEAAVITNAVEQVMGAYRWEEDEDLLEAIAEYEREGGVEWTPELRERILKESEENARRGVPVPYDVTY